MPESTANVDNPPYAELDRLRGIVGEQVTEISDLKDEINSLIKPISEYEEHGASIGAMVALKQKAYGDSFGKAGDVLRILYPGGITPEQYDDLLSVARVVDKLFRIATDKDALGESPYRDIAGYGILGTVKGEHNGSGAAENQG